MLQMHTQRACHKVPLHFRIMLCRELLHPRPYQTLLPVVRAPNVQANLHSAATSYVRVCYDDDRVNFTRSMSA